MHRLGCCSTQWLARSITQDLLPLQACSAVPESQDSWLACCPSCRFHYSKHPSYSDQANGLITVQSYLVLVLYPLCGRPVLGSCRPVPCLTSPPGSCRPVPWGHPEGRDRHPCACQQCSSQSPSCSAQARGKQVGFSATRQAAAATTTAKRIC